jgi:glycerol-3-phosphate cytidylyltransferase/D-beta-D-heptose 7-phosphate kinase/D-beta-D-heptose 1-phosphate adenosyltransferase
VNPTAKPPKASIVSGYFSPLHPGHLELFEQAQARSGYLIVIVNNDAQQILKKGRIVQPDTDRLRIVRALRVVDAAYLAVEQRPGVLQRRRPRRQLHLAAGGDRLGPAQRHHPAVRRRRVREAGLQLANPGRARRRGFIERGIRPARLADQM